MLVNRYYTHNSKPPVDAPLPTILERRLHVCLHNSYTFISAPTVINLRPLTRSNIPIGLHVLGDLKLDGWIQGGDKMLKLVIWVEYRVGFGIGEDGMDKREESVILGWKICDTDSDRLPGLTQRVLLDCSPFPFAKSPMVFRYKPDVHEHNDTIDTDGLFISRQDPIIALFRIHEVEVPKVSSSIESKRVSLTTDNPFADPTPSEEEVHLQAKPESKRSISTSHADSIHASNASSTEDLRECPVPSVDQEFNLRHVQRDTFPISSKHPLTRAQRARLISAGFPTRVDEDGRGLVQVSNDNEPFIRDWNWKIELNDEYVGNEITICLMGLSIFEEEKCRETAKSVYFNYRFFTRESQTSGIFYLYRGSTNQPITQAADDNRDETGPDEWPTIFFPIERRKGEIVSSPSSPSSKIPSLIHFIATKFVQIDIYDADSLLHLGYCRIPLKSMLRQGRKGVELFSEADIVCEMVRF
ncbi:hypothetical protein BKA69DRAFT_188296 [Paraphysoderma sedebokerense]|nr:hypothetical protein BKA69DRAFT_188296 [Paraphysoderma sedebokerense]